MRETNTREGCPTSWLLERYHHGYLSGQERDDVGQHIDGCPHCQGWQMALSEIVLPPLDWGATSQDEGALSAPFSSNIVPPLSSESADPPDIQNAAQVPERSWWQGLWQQLMAGAGRPLFYAGGVACVFALLLWRGALVPPQPLSWTPAVTPTWRAKGSHDWQIYVRRRQSQQVIQLSRQAAQDSKPSLYTDDALRFHFDLTKRLYVMVVSINERGLVSLYYPYPKKRAALLSAGVHRLPKDSAIPLDDYLGAELFVMVAKQKPFSFAQVEQALGDAFRRRAAGGRLHKLPQLPQFVWQEHRLVQKVAVKP